MIEASLGTGIDNLKKASKNFINKTASGNKGTIGVAGAIGAGAALAKGRSQHNKATNLRVNAIKDNVVDGKFTDGGADKAAAAGGKAAKISKDIINDMGITGAKYGATALAAGLAVNKIRTMRNKAKANAAKSEKESFTKYKKKQIETTQNQVERRNQNQQRPNQQRPNRQRPNRGQQSFQRRK